MSGTWVRVSDSWKRKGRPDRPTVAGGGTTGGGGGTGGTGWTRPTGAGYVRYEDVYTSGMSFQQVMNAVGKSNILTLPAGTFHFPANFNNSQSYIAALRLTCRGIAGSGIGQSILHCDANTVTASPKGTNSANKLMDMDQNVSNQYLGGFTMSAGDQGGVLFNGIQVSGPNALVEQLQFLGAHRGNLNHPPGETGGLTTWQANGITVRNVEVDCRDTTGARVGASPIMFNSTNGITMIDTYTHHSYTGPGVTFWESGNITTTRHRSWHNGGNVSGTTGHGINHEQVYGTVKHYQPDLIIDWHNPTNGGMHMSASSNKYSATIQVIDPTFDAGAFPPAFAIYSASTYGGQPETQLKSSISVTKAGVAVPIHYTG